MLKDKCPLCSKPKDFRIIVCSKCNKKLLNDAMKCKIVVTP